MTIPATTDLLALLDSLESATADDLETQWLDFKPWQSPKDDMKVAVEYAACLANAEGGVVVFGVADRTRGRAKAIHGASGYDLDTWRRGIFDSTRPNLTVEVEELKVPEGTGRLLVVRVPRGEHPPYGTAQGLFKQRVGKNCMPMDAQSFVRSQVATGAMDWSGERSRELTLADLDAVEIARARNVLRRNNADSGLLGLSDQDLLTALGAVRNGQVTHAGMLLFCREEKLREHCPQHQVHYVYQVTGTEVARNDSYQASLLNILERFEQIFTSPINPEQELPLGLYRLRIPAFPVEVVREAVLNAVTHRDYLDPGEVLVRHMADQLAITSPGGFIAGITPQNILRHEPASRNRTLAEAFEKLRLVERAGIGRRRIFETMLAYGKRIPAYEADGRVTLRIFDGSFDERTAALVARWRGEGREIGLDGLLVLSFLRDNAFIDTLSAATLLQLSREDARATLDRLAHPETGFLERKGGTKAATFHLTRGISKDLLGKAAYTRTRGVDPIRFAEMVKAFVAHHGSITPRECRELLGLGESNSARVEVSKYLRTWSSQAGFLRREGTKGPKVHYLFR
ncbi:MAG TPA: RNA-binding domain-containing protein [Thermoanaerobaculia bacterium]|nr:RNA-binding domain-containing protein [Thermoanaerobaculia bacterium]